MTDDDRDPHLQSLLRQIDAAGSLDDLDEHALAELAAHVKAARRRKNTSARLAGPRIPQRALALDALDVLGIPATPKMVTALVRARTGGTFDARALTTARRDDYDGWMRDTKAGRTPPPKVAPALHHEVLEPVRALVTNSTWPLPLRTVTPHSPRHDHPAAVLAMLDEAERLSDVDPAAATRVGELACRTAAGIPGANTFDMSPEGRDLIRRAAEQELARFADDTDAERDAAARRAQMLDRAQQVWGRGHQKTSKPAERTASSRSGTSRKKR